MAIRPFSNVVLRDFVSLRDVMDRLLEESVVPSENGIGGFATDLYEKDDAYVLRAELPGARPEDIDIEVRNDQITVSGEWQREEEVNDGSFLRRERRFGRYLRTFSLPTEIDPTRIEATFENGVLTVRMPKAEATRPRHIKVQPGNGQAKRDGDGAGVQPRVSAGGATQVERGAGTAQGERGTAQGERPGAAGQERAVGAATSSPGERAAAGARTGSGQER